ncbi:MAG: leucyl/phenylalanyl-tRNA--protein transferase [Terrimicrobiaceae bacterium]
MIPRETLLGFYRRGVFPMAGPDGLRLFSPDPRGILPIGEFHIPHGTRRAWKDMEWELRVDSCFPEVMLACAEREETWIDETIFRSYVALHDVGHAHSVEIWSRGRLAGGLYGVRIGAAFFGESMFHRVTNASKIALCCLVALLKKGGFQLLDTQWVTPHLARFGAVEIPRPVYLRMLASAIASPADFRDATLSRDTLDGLLKSRKHPPGELSWV